ncbi:MAG TPA: LPS export ABC transporter periplasmic protein LptC [Syntrophorhabdaceae bacterium]|nr:LPS export ABC transporter periplasmic protein LptC [Syntrophorhabdaceae bacterium]HPC67446.1 LPS export ABC transporter periplasmic protein LptC [Syntrophorhabdaceae bacterium]HQE80576.1 LPS export ABC transporter periplasmic protein LptC [Syntrophorhabdaceae bacterium]HQH43922.1 LPS export ABC transporter periplasmic protein LptC [Syntrophorhabdaceae bacterium]HQK47036.1 LPS export ABC transporter periplasmic protein LptC [Syntrophorhabdaceae bacterium]
MKDRKIIVYISLILIIVVCIMAFYFFLRKPVRTSLPKSILEKKVIVFKDVKYSGEKKGVVDWEIKADMARNFIDRPVVEIEGIDGQYRPKPDVIVYFSGKKGIINTEEEKGTVEEVSINYKKEYTLKSRYMDFDFRNGITSTDAPIDIKGERLTLRGIGLIAKTDEETVRIKKDVSGFVVTDKGRFRFESDTFLYMLKENQFILDGRVVMKGEALNLLCSRVSIKSKGNDIEMAEATGKVRLISKGSMAKGEKAVYYFKDDIVTLTGSPKLVRENVEMDGDSITYDMKKGRFNVNMPKVRIERQ